MKVISNDVMRSDLALVIYMADGEAAENFKRKHPALYNWVLPKSMPPPGTLVITNATFDIRHAIFFVKDADGRISAGDMYDCYKPLKDYVRDLGIEDEEIGMTEELYKVIIERDYIKE